MDRFLDTILILGALQGYIVFLLLVSRKPRLPANKVLSLLILIASTALLYAYAVETSPLRMQYPHFLKLQRPLPFLYGPLMLLYCSLFLSRIERLRWIHLLHFIPFLIHIVLLLPFYGLAAAEKAVLFAEDPLPAPEFLVVWIQQVSGFLYYLYVFLMLRRYRKNIKEYFSNTERLKLTWLYTLTGMGLLIWTASILQISLQGIGVSLPYFMTIITGLIISCLVYVIGYFAMRYPAVFFTLQEMSRQLREIKKRDVGSAPNPTKEEEDIRVLTAFVEKEKPYREWSLNLREFAGRAGIPAYRVTRVLKNHYNMNFFTYINTLRVEEMKHLLTRPENRHRSILDISFDAGFHSKTTSNVAFKKVTGQTPGEFRKGSSFPKD